MMKGVRVNAFHSDKYYRIGWFAIAAEDGMHSKGVVMWSSGPSIIHIQYPYTCATSPKILARVKAYRGQKTVSVVIGAGGYRWLVGLVWTCVYHPPEFLGWSAVLVGVELFYPCYNLNSSNGK